MSTIDIEKDSGRVRYNKDGTKQKRKAGNSGREMRGR